MIRATEPGRDRAGGSSHRCADTDGVFTGTAHPRRPVWGRQGRVRVQARPQALDQRRQAYLWAIYNVDQAAEADIADRRRRLGGRRRRRSGGSCSTPVSSATPGSRACCAARAAWTRTRAPPSKRCAPHDSLELLKRAGILSNMRSIWPRGGVGGGGRYGVSRNSLAVDQDPGPFQLEGPRAGRGPERRRTVTDGPQGNRRWWQNPAAVAALISALAALLTAIATLAGVLKGSGPS